MNNNLSDQHQKDSYDAQERSEGGSGVKSGFGESDSDTIGSIGSNNGDVRVSKGNTPQFEQPLLDGIREFSGGELISGITKGDGEGQDAVFLIDFVVFTGGTQLLQEPVKWIGVISEGVKELFFVEVGIVTTVEIGSTFEGDGRVGGAADGLFVQASASTGVGLVLGTLDVLIGVQSASVNSALVNVATDTIGVRPESIVALASGTVSGDSFVALLTIVEVSVTASQFANGGGGGEDVVVAAGSTTSAGWGSAVITGNLAVNTDGVGSEGASSEDSLSGRAGSTGFTNGVGSGSTGSLEVLSGSADGVSGTNTVVEVESSSASKANKAGGRKGSARSGETVGVSSWDRASSASVGGRGSSSDGDTSSEGETRLTLVGRNSTATGDGKDTSTGTSSNRDDIYNFNGGRAASDSGNGFAVGDSRTTLLVSGQGGVSGGRAGKTTNGGINGGSTTPGETAYVVLVASGRKSTGGTKTRSGIQEISGTIGSCVEGNNGGGSAGGALDGSLAGGDGWSTRVNDGGTGLDGTGSGTTVLGGISLATFTSGGQNGESGSGGWAVKTSGRTSSTTNGGTLQVSLSSSAVNVGRASGTDIGNQNVSSGASGTGGGGTISSGTGGDGGAVGWEGTALAIGGLSEASVTDSTGGGYASVVAAGDRGTSGREGAGSASGGTSGEVKGAGTGGTLNVGTVGVTGGSGTGTGQTSSGEGTATLGGGVKGVARVAGGANGLAAGCDVGAVGSLSLIHI